MTFLLNSFVKEEDDEGKKKKTALGRARMWACVSAKSLGSLHLSCVSRVTELYLCNFWLTASVNTFTHVENATSTTNAMKVEELN